MVVVEPEQLDLELFQRASRTAGAALPLGERHSSGGEDALGGRWLSGGGHVLADLEAPFATAERCAGRATPRRAGGSDRAGPRCQWPTKKSSHLVARAPVAGICAAS